MRVLFVCTANVCRSRAAEDVFRLLTWNRPDRDAHEARSAGTQPGTEGRPVTETDVEWADVICVMEPAHETHIRERWRAAAQKVRVLEVPDVYMPGDPLLSDLLATHILAMLAEAAPDTPP